MVHRGHWCSSASSMHPGGWGGSLLAFHSVLVTSAPFGHSRDWYTPQRGSWLTVPSPWNHGTLVGAPAGTWRHPQPTLCGLHTPSRHNLDPRSPRDTRSHGFLGGPGSGWPGGMPRRRGSPRGRREHGTQLRVEGGRRGRGGGREELAHVQGQGRQQRVPVCDGAGAAERS